MKSEVVPPQLVTERRRMAEEREDLTPAEGVKHLLAAAPDQQPLVDNGAERWTSLTRMRHISS